MAGYAVGTMMWKGKAPAAAVVVVAVMVFSFMFAAPVVVGFETEVKPNNYPNFEFTESETTPSTFTTTTAAAASSTTAEVKPHNYNNFQFTESESVPAAREDKPNNYPNFEFTESPGVKPTRTTTTANTNTNAAHQYTTTMPDARDRFSGYTNNNNNNNNDNYVFDADHQYYSNNNNNNNPSAVSYDVETDPTSQSFFSADRGLPTYSTEVDPSSFSSQQQQQQGYESFTNSEVRVNSQHPASQKQAAPAAARTGSSRFYTPASDPDFAFRFAQPASTLSKEARFGANSFVIDSAADETVYSQFNFDNSDATSDPTATYGSTSPAVSSSYDTQLRSRNNNNKNNNNAGGHGCANMYWAEHPNQWPSFFSINTQVAQAFGTKAGDIYGTTTLLQALYDNRSDGYSQLLSHGTASLLNSYTKANFAFRHDAVISQFLGALASRTAAGVQAQKFVNANHAYGPNECQN